MTVATITTPVATGERMDTLDAVRGFAVLGILLINVDAFSGYAFMTSDARRALPMTALDSATWFLLALFIEAKFYSLFSFLFGVGFAVFVERAARRGADAVRLFKRRLVGLLLIGLVHTIFIWMGDILVTYALLGFGLIPFLRRSDRTILRWAIGMLAAPIVLYGGLVIAASLSPGSQAAGEEMPQFLLDATDKFAWGNYVQVVEGNIVFTLANIVRRFMLMFHPRVFGMFLLGLYAGRRGVFADIEGHRKLLVNVCIIGLGIGLPCSFVGAALGTDMPAVPNVTALIETTAKSISAPALALGYGAGLALLVQRARGLMRLLAPVGRMALTNYILQSIAGVFVFYGIGVGLFRRVPLSLVVAGALAFFIVQIVVSRAWLSWAQFGPAEWLWRMFTYRRTFALKRA